MPPIYLTHRRYYPYITQEKTTVKILTVFNSCAISSSLEAKIYSIKLPYFWHDVDSFYE